MIYRIPVTNISDLMQAINEMDNGEMMWYRGHGNRSWATVPSVQRYEKYSEGLERELVNKFRIRAAQILDNSPAKNDYSGWMSLMQHYGLATRLMDWSKSPLIAAYFATEKDERKADGTGYADACIWILWPSHLNEDQIRTPYIYPMDSTTIEEMLSKAFKSQASKQRERMQRGYQMHRDVDSYARYGGQYDTGEFQPRGYGHIVACEPVEHNLRMYSQQACFTVHDTKEEEGETIPTLSQIARNYAENNDGRLLTARVIIPHSAKKTFRKELAMLGITKSFIYPDMDHLSEDIKKQYLEKR